MWDPKEEKTNASEVLQGMTRKRKLTSKEVKQIITKCSKISYNLKFASMNCWDPCFFMGNDFK
jgi:hypothetical protein